eukprot:6052577-Pleurochrysis_carterae.AAC.1
MDMVVRSGGVDLQATRAVIDKFTRRLISVPRDDPPFKQPAPSVERIALTSAKRHSVPDDSHRALTESNESKKLGTHLTFLSVTFTSCPKSFTAVTGKSPMATQGPTCGDECAKCIHGLQRSLHCVARRAAVCFGAGRCGVRSMLT